jgi:hypothetical protein
MKIHVFWDVTSTQRNNPDNMYLQTGTWLMHQDVLLRDFPQLFVFLLNEMMLNAPNVAYLPQCKPLSQTNAIYYWNRWLGSESYFSTILTSCNRVRLQFLTILTVFRLLLSSFIIFPTVLNFVTWSAILQNVLLHFCRAQLIRLSFRIPFFF